MKKHHLSKILLTVTMVVACSFLVSLSAIADDAPETSMFVSPMSQKIILIPGETYEGTIKVANAATSKIDLSYTVDVESFSQDRSTEKNDDYGSVDLTARTSRNQIVDWITLDRSGGSIAPNHSDVVTFRINVPENAPAGGQYATIVFLDTTDYGNKGDGNVIIESQTQMASIIYANVAGETIEKGSITENNFSSFLLNNTLEATSMTRNEGNIYTDAEYILQVWPLFSDEEVCTNEEAPDTKLVLPDTERYNMQTCELPSVGVYKVKQIVKIFGEESIVEKTIIYCPIWLLFIILFVIAAIIIWIVMRVRSRNKSARRATATKSE